MRFKPRATVRVFPSPLKVSAANASRKSPIGIVVWMRGKLMPVQNHFCFRECRNEAAYGRPITSQSRVRLAEHFVNIESIGVDESSFQKLSRYFETNKAQVRWRRKSLIGELPNIKREFCSNVTM